MARTNYLKHSPSPVPRPLSPPRGFTLVELLVVITIIGILTALIVTAAVGAMRKAQETRIKSEINQMDAALVEYKNKTTAFPPNMQTGMTTPNDPQAEAAIAGDFKKHLQQAFPRANESPELLNKILGAAAAATPKLNNGINAAEAIPFWLGGFSSDPKYPISGEGGPSYPVTDVNDAKSDPIESRSWVFPFDITRLGPRDSDGYFSGRFIAFTDSKGQLRRINFWQYAPKNSEQPYLYFDASRHPAYDDPATNKGRYDTPAAADLHVHMFKKRRESSDLGIDFMNAGKFQLLHCGIDDEWGEDEFEKMSVHEIASPNADDYLLFPDGPFIGDIADTIVNFVEQTRIEDAQP
jgi:prepilin-type N-terminal cleavage/methylation domain-containing protein